MLMDGLGFLEHAAAAKVYTATGRVEMPSLETFQNTVCETVLTGLFCRALTSVEYANAGIKIMELR